MRSLQYSCLLNSLDRGAWWATVHGFAKSWTQLNNFTLYFVWIGDSWSSRGKKG